MKRFSVLFFYVINLTLAAGPTAPSITTVSPLLNIVTGTAYSQTMLASGTTPIRWTVTGGKLPAGLILGSSTGTISGTPSSTGLFTFTLMATNAAGNNSKQMSLTVSAALVAPSITTVSPLPNVVSGTAYSQTMLASGTAPLGWAVTGGKLPAGLILGSSTGTISGTPSSTGLFTFTITATNVAGNNSKQMSITVSAAPVAPSITTVSPLPNVVTGTAYSQTMSASGATPIGWAVTSGKLPAGLVLGSSTGKVSGTPSSTGLFTFTVTATNVAGNNSKQISLAVNAPVSNRATYYLAPASLGGKDSNDGLTASSPWLTPNHPMHCGDQIIGAASTAYESSNFFQSWGLVSSCPSANGSYFAELTCAKQLACQITDTANGIYVHASNWAVVGWEVTLTGGTTAGSCFLAQPPTSAIGIHHILFANVIANGCGTGGVGTTLNGSAGVDYVAIVGSAVWNAAQTSNGCNSGINIFEPAQWDVNPGTHFFIGWNVSYDNMNPNPCQNGIPTDGEGIIIDTLSANSYTQQIVIENNLLIFNGGRGISCCGGNAPVIMRQNTVYGNNTDPNQTLYETGELLIGNGTTVSVSKNLAESLTRSTQYVYEVLGADGTTSVAGNFGYSPLQNNLFVAGSPQFLVEPNRFGTNPGFKATHPGRPDCSGYENVLTCFATTIANFTPSAAEAIGYGYQAPNNANVPDPLFPQWLCNVTLPSGLITMGCLQNIPTANGFHVDRSNFGLDHRPLLQASEPEPVIALGFFPEISTIPLKFSDSRKILYDAF